MNWVLLVILCALLCTRQAIHGHRQSHQLDYLIPKIDKILDGQYLSKYFHEHGHRKRVNYIPWTKFSRDRSMQQKIDYGNRMKND